MNPRRTGWISAVVCLCVVLGMALPGWAEPVTVGLVYHAEQAQELVRGRDPLQRYREAIERQGGRVSFLSCLDPKMLTGMKVRQLDALLLPGGVDVDPLMYGETPHPKLEKILPGLDAFEKDIVDLALARGVPILGICRGHQFLNVYFGGTLFQDLPDQLHGPVNTIHRRRVQGISQPCRHQITIVPGSRLHRIIGKEAYDVNSYHHQGVKQLGRGLRATAHAPDGLVEAVEGIGPGYLLGVQFHPEKDAEDPIMQRIIRSLIEAGRSAPR